MKLRRLSDQYTWKDAFGFLLTMALAATALFLWKIWAYTMQAGPENLLDQLLSFKTFAEICLLTIIMIAVFSSFKLIKSDNSES